VIRRLSISSRKFFLGGKGLSFRTGKYFGESMLVGLVAGFVVVGFRYMIRFGTHFILEGIGRHSEMSGLSDGKVFASVSSISCLLDPHRLILLFLPAVGALLGYALIRRFSKLEHARGTDSAIRAYHQRGGYVTGTVVPVKSVASVLTVASGGSAGYEGPVTLLGASVGSVTARWLNLTARARRILMAAGLAAGISALFQAPLAGAIFGFEIFYSSSDVEYETVLPCFIASAVSYTVYSCFFGWGSLFAMPPSLAFDSGVRLFPYFALALAVTFGARLYITMFRSAETRFGDSRMPGWAKVVVGGLVTGAIGFVFPDVLGTSYPLIQACFAAGHDGFLENCGPVTAAGFLCLFFAKAVATSFTVGSGGSGGVFAPALVCGGSLGAAVGMFFARILPQSVGIHPAAFALVGMAGFLASAVRTPIAAIVMVAELSGNHSLLVPAMWVCGISFWLNNGWTLYRSQVHSRESSPAHEYAA